MGVKVYNTLTGKRETLIPNKPGEIGMYVCGPTTYNYIHLGNARPLVVFDTIRRYLEYLGYRVTYVQNFTDVDDKIIKRSQEEGIPPLELARKYIKEYFKDADKLNVKRATFHPQVSEHMDEIIDFIQGLIEKGFAYEVEGDVYFAVNRFQEYGKLSKRSLDDLQAGARVEVEEKKQHPTDFALWKKAKPGEPSWESPWGQGRPGWHIECSAMSHKYLGESFDIHAGGYDLVFPHHENEIAQSEALHGVPMARYWLHNGFITVNEEKMSKSLGNFFLFRQILEEFSPQVVRFYLLSTHYRNPLDFDHDKLKAAEKALERLVTAYQLLREEVERRKRVSPGQKTKENGGEPQNGTGTTKDVDEYRKEVDSLARRFQEAMNDDFNTALAIAVLFDFARAMNTFVSRNIQAAGVLEALEESGEEYRRLLDILGLDLTMSQEKEDSELTESLIGLLLKIRAAARAKKDYETADMIREELKALGIILEDTPQGVRWRYQ
jgi:cysteinyl-tRNA synthetase